MSSLTDYTETALVQHLLMGVPFTAPTDIYLALFTTAPADDGTGGVEVTGGSYARQIVTFELGTAGAGQVLNDALVTFAAMPASTVVGAGLFDASTVGNMLAYEDFGAPVVYAAADNATLAVGALTFTLG